MAIKGARDLDRGPDHLVAWLPIRTAISSADVSGQRRQLLDRADPRGCRANFSLIKFGDHRGQTAVDRK